MGSAEDFELMRQYLDHLHSASSPLEKLPITSASDEMKSDPENGSISESETGLTAGASQHSENNALFANA